MWKQFDLQQLQQFINKCLNSFTLIIELFLTDISFTDSSSYLEQN
jgi:hypothetical protein